MSFGAISIARSAYDAPISKRGGDRRRGTRRTRPSCRRRSPASFHAQKEFGSRATTAAQLSTARPSEGHGVEPHGALVRREEEEARPHRAVRGRVRRVALDRLPTGRDRLDRGPTSGPSRRQVAACARCTSAQAFLASAPLARGLAWSALSHRAMICATSSCASPPRCASISDDLAPGRARSPRGRRDRSRPSPPRPRTRRRRSRTRRAPPRAPRGRGRRALREQDVALQLLRLVFPG